MKPLHELGAAELAPLLARRELTAERLARACLERIAAREPVVRAFVHLDRERVLAGARALDRAALRGPLGLPLGVQVVGRIGDDARTLACAHWVQLGVARRF